MLKWCMEYPFFTFILGILVLLMIDNAMSNLSRVKIAKYESKKESKQ